jgi:hypothetical protein
MASNTLSDQERAINRIFYQGGLQKYFPQDEARIYVNHLLLDSIKHCIKDFSSNEPSPSDFKCVKSIMEKNYQLLNGNLDL